MAADAQSMPTDPSPDAAYPPLASYAVIGDTATLALISESGSIDWLCLPDIDDAASFGRVLDHHRGGHFTLAPPRFRSVERTYRDHTAILEARYETGEGVITVTDLMAIPDRRGFGPERWLIRRIRAERGTPTIRFTYAPRPENGKTVPQWQDHGTGVWRWRTGARALTLLSDVPGASSADGKVEGECRLEEGEERQLRLAFSSHDALVLPGTKSVEPAIERTERFWRAYARRGTYRGPYRDAVARSATMIRLLTFSLSGAILAAGTTSLPEALGGTRNWDYRYCWLRDASFLIRAYLGLGYHDEAKAFFTWIMHATRLTAPELKPCYGVYGRTDIKERRIDRFEGYRGAGPVREGNGAVSQRQLDVYGSVLQAALLFAEAGGRLERSEQRRLRRFAQVARDQWTLPDKGIWEMRGPPRHYTYGKAMCWSALTSYTALIRRGTIRDDPAPYEAEARRIREAILRHGWSEEHQAFTGAFGADFLDASLLLLPRFGIVEAHDPRMVSTRQAIDADLRRGPHLRRYAQGIDGGGKPEGTFWACGFWAVEALARAGEHEEAKSRFEALLADVPPTGSISEERDPDTGALLGNLPQAFSHAALINAALALEETSS